NTSFHVFHISLSRSATSHSSTGLWATRGSSMNLSRTRSSTRPSLRARRISRATKGASPLRNSSRALRTRSSLLTATVPPPDSRSEHGHLLALTVLGEARQLRPGQDQGIVGQGLLGPALALADAEEPVGQVPGHLRPAAQLGHQPGGGFLAGVLVVVDPEQLVGGAPHGGRLVALGVPAAVQLLRPQQADASALGPHDTRLLQTG